MLTGFDEVGYAIEPPKPPNAGMHSDPPLVESVWVTLALEAPVVWPVQAATELVPVGWGVGVGAALVVGVGVGVGPVGEALGAALGEADETGTVFTGPEQPAATAHRIRRRDGI
jgi:hypothetical protein